MILRLLQLTKPQEDLVGLDINSDYIKLLKINTKANPKEVQNFAVVPVPPGAIIKNEIKEPQVVASLLQSTLLQSGIESKNMALAISRSSTIIKNITVDSRLTAEDLENRAWIEANHHFPDLVGESYLDFSVVGSSPKDPNQLEIFLVACRKDVIDPYIELLNLAGLTAKVVDVNSFALERSLFLMASAFPENKTIGLLNLNSNLSTLIVIQDNKLIYAHDEGFDAKRLQTKIREVGEDKEKQKVVLKDNLSTHLRHTIHFFYSTRPHVNIEKLIISGDVAKDIDMMEVIQTETGLPTSLANPLATMAINTRINQEELKLYQPTLVLCSGLAMSQLE